jgi:transcriptional regulator with XRE-family HTH domain
MARDDRGTHGVAVMRFLDAEFTARPDALTSWARDNDIDPSKFSKWRRGESDPDLAGLREIASALGRPTWHLLAAAGFIDADEMDAPPILPTPMPDVDDAIERDPTLSDIERDILRSARDMGKAARAAGLESQPVHHEIKRRR